MSTIDWLVLGATLLLIVLYGIYKSRGAKSMEGFLLGNQSLPWYQVGLSVMATQASAITFLSAPGQAYTDGMRFVQFYFGLPIATVVLCTSFIPIFHKLKVYTAYEYLENRFDLKTRALTAFLFLIQRGLSTAITIYAPAIILSTILGISIHFTTIIIGVLVIIYTVYGGSKAVSYSHLMQMGIIFCGMFMAGYMVVHLLPEDVAFSDALHVAGKMGKLNVLDFKWDLNNKYTIWSGLLGGFFLSLSYFGTDQSQVGRYLAAKSVDESRMGLLMNGLVKVPMQFLILLIGALVFVFYQYHDAPLFFNKTEVAKVHASPYGKAYRDVEDQYSALSKEKNEATKELAMALKQGDETIIQTKQAQLVATEVTAQNLRKQGAVLMKKNNPIADINDSNYIFLSFVLDYLPVGLVGLLFGIIFLAAMGSTASALNSLASTSIVDVYKRLIKVDGDDAHYLKASRWLTVFWGLLCIGMAEFAGRMGNLIEAVNILGSLFYGTILGIFLVAFYLKSIKGATAFYAALIAEALVLYCFWIDLTAFLWLNVIGCGLVVGIALLLHTFTSLRQQKALSK